MKDVKDVAKARGEYIHLLVQNVDIAQMSAIFVRMNSCRADPTFALRWRRQLCLLHEPPPPPELPERGVTQSVGPKCARQDFVQGWIAAMRCASSSLRILLAQVSF